MKNHNRTLGVFFLTVTVFIFSFPDEAHATPLWTKSIGGYANNGHEQTSEANAIYEALQTNGFKSQSSVGTVTGGSSYRNSWYRFSAINGGYFTLDDVNIGSVITIIHKENWVGVATNLCAQWGSDTSFWGSESTPVNTNDCTYHLTWGRTEKVLGINGPTPPSTPSNVRATSTNQDNKYKVTLSWTDTSTNETNFKIVKTIPGGISSTPSSSNVTAGISSYTDTNVTPGSTYYYSVQSCIQNVCSTGTTTSVTVPSIVVCTTTQETLSCNQNLSNYGVPTNQTVGTANFTKNSCTATTTYTGGCSSPVIANTIPVSPLPINALFSPSANSVQITWQDISSNETRFELYRNLTGITSTLLITKDASSTIHIDQNLPSGVYTYAISACNATGCSPRVYFNQSVTIPNPSTTTTATNTTLVPTTIATTSTTTTYVPPVISVATTTKISTTQEIVVNQIPSSPTSATAVRAYTNDSTSNKITITWQDNSSNETKFKIYRSSLKDSTELPIVSRDITSYNDTNVPAGVYTYYIAACNDKGCSSSALTPSVTIPILTTEKTIKDTSKTSYLSEISKAVGKTRAGNFINIIPVRQNQITNTTTFTATAGKDGDFDIEIPDGKYTVEGASSLDSTSTQAVNKEIVVSGGKVISVVEQIMIHTKKIHGKVTSTDGTIITNAEISAYKKETGQWFSGITNTTGHYSIDVTNGTWDITIRPKTVTTTLWDGALLHNSVTFTNENIDEDKESNFIVTPLTSTIVVTVVNENGTHISDVGVIIDTISSSEKNIPSASQRKIKTEKTDAMGSATFRVPPGYYFIRTSLPDSMKELNAVEQQSSLQNSEVKNITVTLIKEKSVEITKVSGVVKFDDGIAVDAFIYAYGDKGGHTQTKASSVGIFSLDITKDQTWHIGATKDIVGKSFKSDEQTILPQVALQRVDIILSKNEADILPPIATVNKNTYEQATVLTDDGARFNVLPGTVSTNGKIDVEIKPTVESASRSASAVVSTTYDITIKNTYGQKISRLEKEAEILLPYDEKELTAKGAILENIIPSYYDESINTWVPVSKFIINREKKVFVLYVNHLTRFALIAAADTVAPTSPTNIVTDAITPTDVKITWNTPSSDFSYSKIYRSEKLGTFGTVVATEVFSNSFIDKTYATNGKTFYYTVRAVDAAGNESINSDQLAFTVTGDQYAGTNRSSSLLLPPGQISGEIVRKLSLGSKGDDVTLLQQALKLDGFYATGPITGYYGRLTENAVFRFQNYYKEELLIPNGYTKGTGVLGPITRKKINEILAKNIQ